VKSLRLYLVVLAVIGFVSTVEAEDPPVFLLTWGTTGTANGQFSFPPGLAVDANGNIYVADQGNYSIQKFTGTGAFLTKWGSEGFGSGQFRGVAGVVVDASDNIYVNDTYNNRIQKFGPAPVQVEMTTWGRVKEERR
jgi:DNA-binding beta-propeller fold protein YncE